MWMQRLICCGEGVKCSCKCWLAQRRWVKVDLYRSKQSIQLWESTRKLLWNFLCHTMYSRSFETFYSSRDCGVLPNNRLNATIPYFWPLLQVLLPVSTKLYFLSAAPFQILNLSPQPSRWPRQCSLHQVLNGRDKPESCHICKQLLKPSHWSILLNCFHLSALNHNHSVRGERSVEYFEQRHVDHTGRGVLIYLLWSGLASADCLVLTKVDQDQSRPNRCFFVPSLSSWVGGQKWQGGWEEVLKWFDFSLTQVLNN